METVKDGTVLILSGGLGGAKFCAGMQGAIEPDRLAIAVNTGDDFDYLGLRVAPVVTVSPLVGGKSVKGPLSKILSELRLPPTPATIAAHYAGLIDGLVVDASDAHLVGDTLPTLAVSAMMNSTPDAERLAHNVLQFADSFSLGGTGGRNGRR